MSAVVNNDNLVIALCSVAVWMLVKLIFGLQRSTSSREQIAWYVALASCGEWPPPCQADRLTLGLVIGLTLFYLARRERSWQPLVMGGLFTGGPMLLVCGWYFWRNWQLYGDPLAWNEMLAVTGGSRASGTAGVAGDAALRWIPAHELLGEFRLRCFGPDGFYRLVSIIMGLMGVGWAVRLIRGRRMGVTSTRFALLILVIWSLTVFVFLLRWMRQIDATNQGRLLFPAIAALGWRGRPAALDGRRMWLVKTVTVALGCWAAAMPLLVMARHMPTPAGEPATIAQPVDIAFGDNIRLLGYGSPDAARLGQPITVSLYWEATQPITAVTSSPCASLDPAGQPVSGVDVLRRGRFATPVWQPGQPFRDTYEPPPITDEAVPGRGTLLVILSSARRTGKGLCWCRGRRFPGGRGPDWERLSCRRPWPSAPRRPESGATFDGRFSLLGYDAPQSVLPGDLMTVTFYWMAREPDGRDYTVFVHLLDEAGQLVAQPMDSLGPEPIPHPFGAPESA